jgi:hypothetical protein
LYNKNGEFAKKNPAPGNPALDFSSGGSWGGGLAALVNKLALILTQDGHKCNYFDAVYLKKVGFFDPAGILCQNRSDI